MRNKIFALTSASMVLLGLAACGSEAEEAATTTTSAAEQSVVEEAPALPELPTAADLAGIMNHAVNPEVPTEEKLNTVVGGESAPEIFDALTQMRAQSGTELAVVDPILPGILPTQVMATMTLTNPGEQPIVIDGVEFVQENGLWKLDQRWACNLIQNVMPDNVPPMCVGLNP